MEATAIAAEGDVSRVRNSKSRQKIIDAQKLIPKSSAEVQLDRIRQLKDSYDLAILKAEELTRHPVSNLYQKVHSDRAKRVFSALSSLIFSTISFSKAKGLEDYIRQNAVSLPATLIDLNEWEYVLKNVQDCRESMIIRSTPRVDIPFDVRKKMELCQFLATQPIRNAKDEIQMLRQSVVEQLNEFYNNFHQSLNMVLYVIQQIKDLNRKDENLAKIKHLEEQVDTLKQEVISERLSGIDKLHQAEKSYELEADRLKSTIKSNASENKKAKESMVAAHDEELKFLKNRIESLNRDLAQADDKIRTRDRKLASQNQLIQELEASLSKEKAASKRLSELQEADIVAVTSSLTSEMVMSQAVNICTFLKEFRDPQQVIKDLHDFRDLKIEVEHLTAQNQQFSAESKRFEEQNLNLEQELHDLQKHLADIESQLSSTRQEYSFEKTRLEKDKAMLENALAVESSIRSDEHTHFTRAQEELQSMVQGLSQQSVQLREELDSSTSENASIKLQNENLHRENQELRIQLLEKDNEKIVSLQLNMNSLVAQQEELKTEMNRSNEVKENILKESLAKEKEKIVALESHIDDLSQEIVKMKDHMNAIEQSNNRETDKATLHDVAIDFTTQILDIRAQLDHLTHEKDIVMQLIKIGEIVRAENEPRVITLMQNIQTLESKVKEMQDRMSAMNPIVDSEHISESMKYQQTKLSALSKNLDRLMWEIAALKAKVEEGILPHELEPNAALRAIKKLEGQIVGWQSKVITAEDTRQWQDKFASVTAQLQAQDKEIVALREQNAKHLVVIQAAASHIQELIGAIEGETANALELFQQIQLVEDELLNAQEKLVQSENMALALTCQIQQMSSTGKFFSSVPKSEHEQVVRELENEILVLQEKLTAAEQALQKSRPSPDPTIIEAASANNNAMRRRSVGFVDSRNEVIMIKKAENVATPEVSAVTQEPLQTEVSTVTATVEDVVDVPASENEPSSASKDDAVAKDDSSHHTPSADDTIASDPIPSLPFQLVSASSSQQPSASLAVLGSGISPRPESSRSVNSVSSVGSKSSVGKRTAASGSRNADHYIAQQQTLTMVKDAVGNSGPYSNSSSIANSPRAPTGTNPETSVEPVLSGDSAQAKAEVDEVSNTPAYSTMSIGTIDEDIMIACPGTVQGDTGWYLAHNQYFYFVRDDTSEEFLLLCGPLSPALYDAAQEEDAKHHHPIPFGAPKSMQKPHLKIDSVSVHATRFHIETLLQDIQERDENLNLLQSLEEENQMHQRDIGILLGKLAEYEAQIQALQSGNADVAPVPGSSLEGTDVTTSPTVPAAKLLRQDTQEVLSGMMDMNFELSASDNANSLGERETQANPSSSPSKKLAAIESIDADMANAMNKITSVARGFLARQRVQQLKLYRLAEETGVLVAMGNTVQGESGWYAGPNGQIFYFVLHNGQWIYAAGPIDGDTFRRLLQDTTSLHRKLTTAAASPKSTSVGETNAQAGPILPLLKKCSFPLSGIHGDLAESGEVYIHLQTLRLHLSLNVEDLMVALQQSSLAGGGVLNGVAGESNSPEGEHLMQFVNRPKGSNLDSIEDDISDVTSYKRTEPNEQKEYDKKKHATTKNNIGTYHTESSEKENFLDDEIRAFSKKNGEGSIISSVMSINDDSVDSLEV
jgi:hypothetical protein